MILISLQVRMNSMLTEMCFKIKHIMLLFIDSESQEEIEGAPECVQILSLIPYCGKPHWPSSLLGLNGTGEEPWPLGAGLTSHCCPNLNWLLLLLFHISNYPLSPCPQQEK